MVKLERSLLIFTADIVAFAAALYYSVLFSEYFSENILMQNYFNPTSEHGLARIKIYAFLVALTQFFFFINGHYTKRGSWWEQLKNILITLLFIALIDGFLNFAMKSDFSRLWVVSSWVMAGFFICAARYVCKLLGDFLGFWEIETVIIGNGDNAVETLYALNSEKYAGFKPACIIFYKKYADFKKEYLPSNLKNIKIIYGKAAGLKYISANKNKFFVLAPEAFQEIDGEEVINLLEKTNVAGYSLVPPTKGLRIYDIKPEFFFGHYTMLITPRHRLQSLHGKVSKRVFDVFLSSISLLAAAPLFLIISLFVKLDGGPIFFVHKRVGKGGTLFKCYKFRTMRPDSEKMLKNMLKDKKVRRDWEKNFSFSNDPRQTKIGRFLRATSLDELPQLINILLGNMSLVGPRPITRGEKKFYDEKIKTYYQAKPGLTGLFQVSGRKNIGYKYRVYLDCWYIDHWSLWADVVIIIKTFRAVIAREGAY